MNRNAWSDDERVEYDLLCDVAWHYSRKSGERNARYIELLRDAEQAQRYFAKDCLDDAVHIGAASHLKSWRARQQRGRIPVSYEGKILSARRVIGTTEINEDGDAAYTQELFDFFTWEQLEAKAQEYVRNIRAYRFDLDVVLRLLELRDLVPEAGTPAEAVEHLGTTIEEFLGGAAA